MSNKLYVAKGGQLAMFKGVKAQPSSHAGRGMALEKALEVVHDYYARKGEAFIGKQYVPTQVVQGGQWAQVVGKGAVDYIGVLDGGRHVAFDAKDCAEKRIDLSRLKPHQLEHLRNVTARGGMAFVLARFHTEHGGWVYVIPAEVWWYATEAHIAGHSVLVERYGFTATGKASINVGELPDEWRVDGVDWLRTVERMGRK